MTETSSIPPATGGKSCASCGINLDAKPNYKIGSGKYLCPDCMEKAKAAKFAMKAKAAGPQAKAAEADSPTEDNSFLFGMGSKTAIAETGTKPCPECGRALTADAVICTGCGFNTDSGKRTRVRILKPEKAKDDKPTGPKPSIWTNPHVMGIGSMVIFGVFGALRLKSPEFDLPFALTAIAFWVGTWFWAVAKAIEEYEGYVGRLLFMIPFFPTYFVFFKQDSALFRWLWVARYVIGIIFIVTSREVAKELGLV